MTTTNGSGDPSMEEILASIRNIIAQDPPSDQVAGAEPAAGSAPKPSVQPASPSPASSATNDQNSDPFAQSPGIDLRASPAAGLLPPERAPSRAEAPAAPQYPSPDNSSSTRPNRTAAAPAADDFSDVFEEPLQPLSISPAPIAKAEAPPRPDAGTAEPQHPGSSNGAVAPIDVSESNPSQPENLPLASATPVAAPAQRKEFDFGKLRPSSKDDPKRVSVASELFGLSKPGGDEPAKETPGLAQRLTEDNSATPAPPEKTQVAGETPRRKVVIAAMPTTSEETPVAAEPPASETTETEAKEPDSIKSASAPADFPPPAAGNEEVGLKNANVGFLAASPRPIEPSQSKATEAGKAFFDAVAGEQKKETVFPAPAPEVESIATDAADNAEVKPVVAEAGEGPPAEAEAVSQTAESLEPSEPAAELAEVVAAEEASPADVTVAAGDAATQSLAQGLSVANIVVSNDGGKVRTLEDTVGELLRPLLREWLENNMPRIVESALRLEVADSVKKQLEVSSQKANGVDK